MSMTRPAHPHPNPTPQPPPSHPQQPPSPPHHTLDLTIISAKHLKNVNWKSGLLKPYCIFWVDPDLKLTTKSDDSSNTKPVWNQRFSLSFPTSTSLLSDVVLTLEVFHSKTTETPKPFVGSTKIRLSSLSEPENGNKIRTFDLLRPSGRPQGKIRLKLAVNYQNAPQSGMYYYQNAPQYTPYSVGYYPRYYSSPPQPPVTRSYSERNLGYGAPSAPVDYSPYEFRPRVGPGLGVGAVSGVLGGLVLDEGFKYEEEKIGERVEDNYLGGASSSIKDDFSEYRADY